jgi:hypothetical protein
MEKNIRVLNWPPPKIGRVQNFGELRGGKFWTLPFFEDGKFLTLSFEKVASSGLCCFLHSGKNSGPPCMYRVSFFN